MTRDQKLLPHFSEAGAAVFSIEQVEYGGHRCPRRLTITVKDISTTKFRMSLALSVAVGCEPIHRLRQFETLKGR
ncbi:hypothetical protein [Bradyrhizobium hipponense]|uniref:hypothetical protein n=1 Tax=Bradyrhizobium hipponense TaxID=2605638 RepID=UPI001652E867|nr:hypothetical protein [Bradyrhizobium hipponense]